MVHLRIYKAASYATKENWATGLVLASFRGAAAYRVSRFASTRACLRERFCVASFLYLETHGAARYFLLQLVI